MLLLCSQQCVLLYFTGTASSVFEMVFCKLHAGIRACIIVHGQIKGYSVNVTNGCKTVMQ